jgi:hypothetical protein
MSIKSFHNNNPRHKCQQSYQKYVKSQNSGTKGNDGSKKISENAQKNLLTSGVKESHERRIKSVINAFQSLFMAGTERTNKHAS